jgi:hypothetical protein
MTPEQKSERLAFLIAKRLEAIAKRRELVAQEQNLNRTGSAKSNMYDNLPTETKYIYTDEGKQGKQMNGQNLYSITFAKGQVPPVKGFWSVTLYDQYHLFNPNPLKRYSLGTKNNTLTYNEDGSLTLYARCQIARCRQGK